MKLGRRRILSLIDFDGTKISNHFLLKSHGANFFKELYTEDNMLIPFSTNSCFPVLFEASNLSVVAIRYEEEVKVPSFQWEV